MPSPFKLTQIYQALTAKNPILKRKLKLGTKEISQPPIKQDVEEIEVVNRFIRDNPRTEKAGGGRIGYRKAGDVDPPKGNELEIAEKKYSEKYNKKGIDLWKELKQFERSNIRQKQTTGGTGGVPGGKLKKNQIGKDDFIKLVNQNKDKTYNQFVEILKDYKTKDNKPFTKNIVADRLRDYDLSGTFKKEPPKGNDPTVKAAAERKRQASLKESDPTGAKGTKKFNYHHITQIEGGIPLTSDDVSIINQRLNSKLGGETNKALNRISAAIRKNNILALEAMNNKQEGLALDYMKRSDELNAQAEKIVNSAIDDLPKKYKNYVGFKQFTLPRDEYGLPIQKEPMIVKKIGGMPVSKDSIDLTTLTKKGDAEFKKIVKAQAERGEIGPIKIQANILKKMGFKCKYAKADGGRIGLSTGSGDCNDPDSYTDDINKTRQDLKSDDVRVRAAAQAKLNKGLQVAKTLPTIGKFLRRVGQATVGGVSKALQITGFGTPVGLAIEGMVEGGIYDYYRGQGYTHDQAYQETFFPGMFSGRPEGVPWYGGAESLLEKELLGSGFQQNPKVLQYQKALEDQEQVFDAFGRKEKFKKLEGTDQGTYKKLASDASADIQDLNRSGTISSINRIMNPESMASQAYQTALENQAGAQDRRARDYKAENYVQKELSDFEEKKLQKKRNKDMLQMFPPPTVDTVRDAYTDAGYGDSLKFFTAQDYRDKIKDFDDYQKQSYFADNFRLEKAGGGIAKIAGVDQGPPPESGPNPQGLPGLLKRVRNY
jgi:hypothetical protein